MAVKIISLTAHGTPLLAVTRPTNTTAIDMGGATTDIHVEGLECDVKVSVKWISISVNFIYQFLSQ